MKILVINSGSSSIKCQYFIDHITIASLLVELISDKNIGRYTINYQDRITTIDQKILNYHQALKTLFDILYDLDIISSIDELDGVGHRVVHGGDIFSEPTLITQKVLDDIRSVSHLAPLHNPNNIDGIEITKEIYPDIPQVAIFDTAFHQSMPSEAYLYPLPYKFYKDYNIRRYGFHGTSHLYVAKRVASLMHRELNSLNLITLHLGNGASVAAIKNAKSIDTTMGFTPLEGLMMGSRCGDIDPAIIPYLIQNHPEINIDNIDDMLNKESGLLGICGTSNMRTVTEQAQQGDTMSQIALDMYTYRIKKYIGAYCVALGRVDAIVFTGGIGENSAKVREMACRDLEHSIYAKIDIEKNQLSSSKDREIHQDDSKIKIFVINTNEELEIAIQTEATLPSNTPLHPTV